MLGCPGSSRLPAFGRFGVLPSGQSYDAAARITTVRPSSEDLSRPRPTSYGEYRIRSYHLSVLPRCAGAVVRRTADRRGVGVRCLGSRREEVGPCRTPFSADLRP